MNYPVLFHAHRPPKATANLFVVIERNGVTDYYESSNTITDIGEAYLADLTGFDNATSTGKLIYISLGNATISATLTKLTTEATTSGFARATNASTPAIKWLNGTDYALNITITFTATATITVDCAGLHWAATGNSDSNMFACAYLTDGTDHQFTAGSTCTVTWIITFDAN